MAKIQALKSMGSQAQAQDNEDDEGDEDEDEEDRQLGGGVSNKVGLPNDVNIFSNSSRGKRSLKVRLGFSIYSRNCC